jgi:hypothetical protein
MVIVTMVDNQPFKRINLLLVDPVFIRLRAKFHIVWFVPLNCIWVFLSFCGLSRSSNIAYRHLVSCLHCTVRIGLHILWVICAAEHLATLSVQKNNCLAGPVDPLIFGVAGT